MVIIEELKHF